MLMVVNIKATDAACQATFTVRRHGTVLISRDSKRTSFFRMGQTSVTGYFSILIMTSLFVGSCRVNDISYPDVGILFPGRITSILPREYVG